MQNIQEKAQDDQEFLQSYGSVRTSVPSQAYRDGWDRIFGSADREVISVDVTSLERAESN